MLRMRCPQCQQGHLFVDPNSYNPSTMSKMHDKCPVCGEDFKREPGFYFGAAYVSYALTVALWIAVLVALITFDAIGLIEYSFYKNPLTFLLSGIAVLLLLFPLIYRLSRSIWINIFVKTGAGPGSPETDKSAD